MTEDWTGSFQGTSNLPRAVRDQLVQRSRIIEFARGEVIFSPRKPPDHLLFLLEGRVRVSQMSESGREIVLYRVTAGESCVLTTACILTEEAYNAEGVAETPVRAVALRKAAFDDLAAKAPEFRDFIFAAYSRRLIDLLRVIDDVAFGRIDMRLASRLLALADESAALDVTHAQLATELGTAREVISRQLNEFQRRGWLSHVRGRIELRDKSALKTLSEAH